MRDKKRMIGVGMSIRMGITLSFFMSLTGTLSSGHFTAVGFIMSFIISTVISLLIGFLIPVGPIAQSVSRALKLKDGSIPARLVETFIYDLIYTPIMTFLMVFMAYQMILKQSGGMVPLRLGGMYFRALVLCFIIGFILIYIIQPIFLKSLIKKYENDALTEEK